MLCDKCGKNNATTHIKQIINGVVTERNLAAAVPRRRGTRNSRTVGLRIC